jgi:hypothetical protein
MRDAPDELLKVLLATGAAPAGHSHVTAPDGTAATSISALPLMRLPGLKRSGVRGLQHDPADGRQRRCPRITRLAELSP